MLDMRPKGLTTRNSAYPEEKNIRSPKSKTTLNCNSFFSFFDKNYLQE
jgi:hypothetical protein